MRVLVVNAGSEPRWEADALKVVLTADPVKPEPVAKRELVTV